MRAVNANRSRRPLRTPREAETTGALPRTYPPEVPLTAFPRSAGRRSVRLLVTALLGVMLIQVGGPSAAAVLHVPTSTWATPASEASAASREARALRVSTAAMIQRYLDEYGDRFTAAEATRLRSYKATADRNLSPVVVTTRRLASLIEKGAPRATVLTAARAAQRAHARARVVAEDSYRQARAIVEPKLSLFEGLQALGDYDAMITRFDAVGERLDAIVRSYRAA